MKKLIVPTDFSETSVNAAHYAAGLAANINAQIKLCHALKIPSETLAAAQMAWPAMDYEAMRNDADHRLAALADELNTTDELEPAHYFPETTETNPIPYSSQIGDVSNVIRNQIGEEKGIMVIMGIRKAGFWTRLFTGTTRREVISTACFPVLLVPSDFKYRKITKIALATDLKMDDVEVIFSLASIAKHFNAEILLFHINMEAGSKAEKALADTFLKDVKNKVNYHKIYFRDVDFGSVKDGMLWLCEHDKIDILAMVHRKEPAIERMLGGSQSQQLAIVTPVPLLIYPEGHLVYV